MVLLTSAGRSAISWSCMFRSVLTAVLSRKQKQELATENITIWKYIYMGRFAPNPLHLLLPGCFSGRGERHGVTRVRRQRGVCGPLAPTLSGDSLLCMVTITRMMLFSKHMMRKGEGLFLVSYVFKTRGLLRQTLF